MADGSPAGPADGLTPEQEEVRRLLADARHAGPMPDDVVDRLDQVLAGLAADPANDPDDDRVAAPAAPVVSLASRRRRRATTALVAAAAVVAVGIGLGQVIGDGVGGGGSADSSAASSAQERRSDARPTDCQAPLPPPRRLHGWCSRSADPRRSGRSTSPPTCSGSRRCW